MNKKNLSLVLVLTMVFSFVMSLASVNASGQQTPPQSQKWTRLELPTQDKLVKIEDTATQNLSKVTTKAEKIFDLYIKQVIRKPDETNVPVGTAKLAEFIKDRPYDLKDMGELKDKEGKKYVLDHYELVIDGTEEKKELKIANIDATRSNIYGDEIYNYIKEYCGEDAKLPVRVYLNAIYKEKEYSVTIVYAHQSVSPSKWPADEPVLYKAGENVVIYPQNKKVVPTEWSGVKKDSKKNLKLNTVADGDNKLAGVSFVMPNEDVVLYVASEGKLPEELTNPDGDEKPTDTEKPEGTNGEDIAQTGESNVSMIVGVSMIAVVALALVVTAMVKKREN